MSLTGLDILPIHQICQSLKAYKHVSRGKTFYGSNDNGPVLVRHDGVTREFANLNLACSELDLAVSDLRRGELHQKHWTRCVDYLIWLKGSPDPENKEASN